MEVTTMENKKNLKINAVLCDVRKVTEEYLSHYNNVKISTTVLITSAEAQAVLGKCGVKIDAVSNISLTEDIRFSLMNGPVTISASQIVPGQRTAAMINGPVTLEPGCEGVLGSYAFLCINGPVTCPESMVSLLNGFQINGPIRAYPDGAIVLKKNTVLDRVFHLRAKQDVLYYAAKQVVALAPDINFEKLAEKNVRFATRRLLVAESLAEHAVPLFDEKTDIEVLPDGCAYVDDDAVLDDTLVRRYGGKLYIDGDLTVNGDSAAALDQVSYLRVDGTLLVSRGMKDRVLGMELVYNGLEIVGSALIQDRPSVEVSAAMLEDAEDGVSVIDCAQVDFAGDITPALLKEKLVSLTDCACVNCTEEQRPVIEAIAQDVAHISCGGEEEESEEERDEDTVSISAVSYII